MSLASYSLAQHSGRADQLVPRTYHSPLHRAAAIGTRQMVLDLLKTKDDGVNLNSVLAEAVQANRTEIIPLIIKAGADVNEPSPHGDFLTVLYVACLYRHSSVVKVLLKYGAKANLEIKGKNTQPILFAAIAPLRFQSVKAIATVRKLIAAGVNVNETDIHGRTPLHDAALCRQPLIARMLIDAGANVNAQDKNGETPLYRLRVNYPDDYRYVKATAKVLLDAGAGRNIRDNKNQTAEESLLELQEFKIARYIRNYKVGYANPVATPLAAAPSQPLAL